MEFLILTPELNELPMPTGHWEDTSLHPESKVSGTNRGGTGNTNRQKPSFLPVPPCKTVNPFFCWKEWVGVRGRRNSDQDQRNLSRRPITTMHLNAITKIHLTLNFEADSKTGRVIIVKSDREKKEVVCAWSAPPWCSSNIHRLLCSWWWNRSWPVRGFILIACAYALPIVPCTRLTWQRNKIWIVLWIRLPPSSAASRVLRQVLFYFRNPFLEACLSLQNFQKSFFMLPLLITVCCRQNGMGHEVTSVTFEVVTQIELKARIFKICTYIK